MPRPPRPQFPGAVYHVYVHAAWGEIFFRRASDFDVFFWLLDRVVEKYSWNCIAYCFMDTHVHLVIETPLPNISDGMQQLLGQYAQGFNRRYGRRGHFVERRFGSVLVEDDRQLLAVVRYLALNPVAAGRVAGPRTGSGAATARRRASSRRRAYCRTRPSSACFTTTGRAPSSSGAASWKRRSHGASTSAYATSVRSRQLWMVRHTFVRGSDPGTRVCQDSGRSQTTPRGGSVSSAE